MRFRLVALDKVGNPVGAIPEMAQAILEANEETARLLRRIGYEPPWTGYVSLADDVAVGGGAFVGPPRHSRVEIAYYTLVENEGRGFGRRTAAELIRIARLAIPGITVFAKTLPSANASTTILQNLGFARAGLVRDEEIGGAWLWELTAHRMQSPLESKKPTQ